MWFVVLFKIDCLYVYYEHMTDDIYDIKSGFNRKLNCREFKKCGHELGGERAFELGVCPAATDVHMDGVHDGINAGRACWVIGGTMCDDNIHGAFAEKYKKCGQCDFYEYVKSEEKEGLIPTMNLLKIVT